MVRGLQLWFQFPSNGKALSDTPMEKVKRYLKVYQVSIPFKRESPFGHNNHGDDAEHL